jgi:hypothetical protein
MRVYLAEPDEDTRTRIAGKLRQAGCKVTAAGSYSLRLFKKAIRRGPRVNFLVVRENPPARAGALVAATKAQGVPTATLKVARSHRHKKRN